MRNIFNNDQGERGYLSNKRKELVVFRDDLLDICARYELLVLGKGPAGEGDGRRKSVYKTV